MRSNNRISRSSRTGAIVAVVSTEVPIDSVVVLQNGNMMITLSDLKINCSKRVEREGMLMANTASSQR